MDGNESQQPTDRTSQHVNASISRRQSSLIKPFGALKRIGSKLTTHRSKDSTSSTKGGLGSTKDNIGSIRGDLVTSRTKLISTDENFSMVSQEDSLSLPSLPKLPDNSNPSEESFFTGLNTQADHPKYWSNPAPGLGYKPSNQAALVDEKPAQLPTTKPVRLSKPDFLHRERTSTSGSFSYNANEPTSYSGQHQKTINVPISNLMAPIQPGQHVSRGVIRSSTTGNLGQPDTGFSQQYNKMARIPRYMRPTSSSAARKNQLSPVSDGTSTRRASVVQPIALRPTRLSGQGLSSSSSNRVLRANVKSDLPFREIYGSDAPGNEDVSHDETDTPRIAAFGRLTSPLPLPEEAPHFHNADKPSPEEIRYRAVPNLIKQERNAELPPKQEQPKGEAKPMENLLITETTPTDELERECEAEYRHLAGLTTTPSPEYGRTVSPSHGLDNFFRFRTGEEMFPSINEAMSSDMDYDQDTLYEDAGPSCVIRGNQRGRMGIYEGNNTGAHRMQRESIDYGHGNTIVGRGGNIGDTDTSSPGSTLMRVRNQPQFSMLEEDDDSVDPRNVYTAMPPQYWSGRVSGLDNLFRNETLTSRPVTAWHPMMDDTNRLRRVGKELAGFCKTPQAQKSLEEFLMVYWQKMHPGPLIAPPTPAPRVVSIPAPAKPADGGSGKKKGGMFGKVFRRKSGV